MSTELNKHLERILELPGLIAEASNDCNHKDEIETLKESLKDEIIDLKTEAGMETDEKGKKLYTNDEQRTRRANVIAKDDNNYQIVMADLRKIEAAKLNAEINREQLRNELSALKAVIFAMTEQLKTENITKAALPKTVTVEVHHVAE